MTRCCTLQTVPEIGYIRESFNRSVANAVAHNSTRVIPWIALGCGYRRQFDTFETFDLQWNYDYIYSWQLGKELNQPWFAQHPERFSSWDYASHTVFYPSIWDRRTANVTVGGELSHWRAAMQHFVAYVLGSAGIYWKDQTLPPIQP